MSDTAAAGDTRRSALLLINTGTPTAATPAAVRRFLRLFLSDRRVIELPRWAWLPLLYAVVLPIRSRRSARKYQRIWLENGSPLLVNTSKLREALARQLQPIRAGLRVEQAFLYSPPQVAQVMESLRQAGVQRLIILPLFPQASGSTTGAVFDQVSAALRRWRAMPQLRIIEGYYSDGHYIAALAQSIRDHWRLHGRADHLLMSFHGIPLAYADKGDRYPDECRETAARLAAALDLSPQEWTLSFQSRFGANRWLVPATSQTLEQLPGRGVRTLAVICPGFGADCLETLEEIALEGRETFLHAGGTRFDYISALNARSDHAAALAQLVLARSSDWT